MQRAKAAVPGGAALCVSAAILGASPHAHAFKPIGHDVVEATAYRRLLERAEAGPSGESGKRVLRDLMARRVLERPRCFRQGSPECEDGPDDAPAKYLPPVGSGAEDLWLTRQLTGGEQCFHYMARPKDVYESEVEVEGGVPEHLALRAPSRCVRFLNGLVQKLVGARTERSHIAYAMIHAVVDSYSAAHVERDPKDWSIRHLKAWRLTGAIPYLFEGGPTYWGTRFHHTVSDGRDDDWVRDREDCVAPPAGEPYGLDESCLTVRASEAADTVALLLLALHSITSDASARPHPRGHHDPAWLAFLSALVGPHGTIDLGLPTDLEQVSEANSMVGVGETYRFARDEWEIFGAGVLRYPELPFLAPFVMTANLEVGARAVPDSAFFVRSPIVAFTLPVTSGFAIDIPLPIFEITPIEDEWLDVRAHLVAFNVWTRGSWIRLSAFEYSFREGDVDVAPSIVLGASTERGLTDVFDAYGETFEDAASIALGVPNAARVPRSDREWTLPSRRYRASRGRLAFSLYLAELTFGPDGGAGAFYGLDLSYALLRDGAGTLAGLGVHGRALAGSRDNATTEYTPSIGPVVRVRVAPEVFALSEPATAVARIDLEEERLAAFTAAAMPIALAWQPRHTNALLVIEGPTATHAAWRRLFEEGHLNPDAGGYVGARLGATWGE